MDRKKITKWISKEWFFLVATFGLLSTSIYLKRFPKYSLNDFKVIYTLFIFLVIIKGLEKSHLIHNISLKLSQRKFLPQKLILFTAVLSMFVTNDVALFVMIPLTISLDIEGKTTLVILETLVANGVSSLMPFGNPQNIFIYYYYNVHPLEFIKTIAPFSFISLVLIMLASLKLRKNEIKDNIEVFTKHERKAYVYLYSFSPFWKFFHWN